jgi:hydroxymethylpyrimidine/phosphomethylpyrimidine kinase
MSSHWQVLCLSGLDPTGGAGLQADVETVAALGGHALVVATVLTVQDTRNVASVAPVAPVLLAQQLDVLLSDCRPAAIKLGLLGGAAQLPPIVDAIRRCRVPVVCDPVLRAGGGTPLAGAELIAGLRTDLFPLVTVLTPNAAEARRLSGAEELNRAGAALIAAGCANVLITGGDEPGEEVVNRWYSAAGAGGSWRWPRLPETFHGAGCTLAAAIALQLARGAPVGQALEQAQSWTQQALRRAFAIGGGRRIPGRFPEVPG